MEKEKLFNNEDLETFLKYRLNICLVILSFFLFLHCFFSFVTFIIFAILLCLIIFDSLKNAITYLVYYYPFCMIDITINEILFGLLIVAFLIKYIIKIYIIGKSKPDWRLCVMCGVFIIYCLLPFGPYSMNTFARMLGLMGVLFALLIAIKDPSMIRFKFNVKILALALVVSSLFALTFYISPFLSDYLQQHHGRFKALFAQPDTLAAFCAVVASILVYYILCERADKLEIILFIALTVIGLCTFGKAFLILMAIEYIALFFYGMQKKYKKTLIIVGSLALFVLIVCLIGHEFVEKYIGRFLNGEYKFDNFADFINVITTYRYELWDVYCTELTNNPLILFFGAGIGTGPIGPRALGAHNMYISMIYELGLVGSLMFITILTYMIVKLKRKTGAQVNGAVAVPAIVCGLLFLVEDIIFYMNVI